jgi:hypothetical protein
MAIAASARLFVTGRIAVEQGGDEHQDGHDHRAQHGRLGPDHQCEADHHDDRNRGRYAVRDPEQTAEHPDGRRQDPDVEAGDGQDVVNTGAAKGVVDVAGELGAIAEQQSGEQRRRHGRQRASDRGDRFALDPHRPRRAGIVEWRHRFGTRGADDVDVSGAPGVPQ